MKELKLEELSKLYSLPNYHELIQDGFISMKAEYCRMYINKYNELSQKYKKWDAIHLTADYFNVSWMTIYRYVKKAK